MRVHGRGIAARNRSGELEAVLDGPCHERHERLGRDAGLAHEARRHALDRLVQNATTMGANAILMMRFDSAEIGNNMSEIVAYGTAAVIEPAP